MSNTMTNEPTTSVVDKVAENPAAFAALGEGQIAYVRPMLSDEIRATFPQAPALQPGLKLFALISASGAPILLADSREAALANAMANELRAVSVH